MEKSRFAGVWRKGPALFVKLQFRRTTNARMAEIWFPYRHAPTIV